MDGCPAPEGRIGLLFTDIEGSTRLATELGSAWSDVLAVHHSLVGGAIAAEGGFVDGTEGDAFFATFADVAAAARAAVAAQRALSAREWPAAVGELRVRMGLHVGDVERARTGYVGLEVHRAHGGQLLMTGPAAQAIAGIAPVEPLDAWQERGSELHLLDDLEELAELLAVLRHDPEALELLGMIEAQTADVYGPSTDPQLRLSERSELAAAKQRAGLAGAELRARGWAVAHGMRALRASQLARVALGVIG